MQIRSFTKPQLPKYFICLIILIAYGCSNQETIKQSINQKSDIILPISFAEFDQWTEQNFVGQTEYQTSKSGESGSEVLKIKSDESASLFYKKIFIDLNQTPYINWQWLITNIYPENTQEKLKQGDDFPARIYIAIKPELGQFKPRALTYVWASNEKKLNTWKNPFNNTVGVFVVESGSESLGKWRSEKRNLKDDLSIFFGQSIESIEGIGVMSDSDNTQGQSEALFRNLFFSNH